MIAEPVVNGLQAELAGKLTVLRVDINSPAGREMSAQTGSSATPTFIFYDASGNELWRQIGSLDAEKVRVSVP
ncbi:MAG: thioredoxin family protein [Anaerolineales bacterium]